MNSPWRRLRQSLWRRSDWSVVRGKGSTWHARLPSGRYVSTHEHDEDIGHDVLTDAQAEARAYRFRSDQDARDWLDAHYPTDEPYPDREPNYS